MTFIHNWNPINAFLELTFANVISLSLTFKCDKLIKL